MRDPADLSRAAPPARSPYCTVPHNSPLEVRGARNDPCPGNPALRAATAAGCGLNFQPGAAPTARQPGPGRHQGSSPVTTAVAAYDPGTGLIVGPGGLLYYAGAGSTSGTGPATLGQLLRQTLGD